MAAYTSPVTSLLNTCKFFSGPSFSLHEVRRQEQEQGCQRARNADGSFLNLGKEIEPFLISLTLKQSYFLDRQLESCSFS